MSLNRADFLAGLSVAGLLLPEAVAYSSIANLQPQHAIFAAVAGLLIYSLLGRSRFAIVSPTSSSAAILAAAVGAVTLDTGAASAEPLAYGAVILTGLFFLIAGFARLGFLANFISRPVLRGFAFGLAITIVVSQLPHMANVHVPSGDPFHVLLHLAQVAANWNWPSILTGAASLAALVLLKRIPAVPAAFLVLVGAILVSLLVDLKSYGVDLVGHIDAKPDMPSLPHLTLTTWAHLARVAAPLFLIVYAESWGSMRNLALRHGDTLDANLELRALGFANAASGLVHGMPVGAGFSGSSANDTAGAQSRLSGFVAGIAIIIFMVFAGDLIALLPTPVLAAVVISALFHALEPAPLIRLWKIDRDQYVAVAAALAVMMLGVLNGMLVAVALSLLAILQRLSQPRIDMLGRLGDSHDFVDCARHPDVIPDPHILVLRPARQLFFANAEAIMNQVAKLAKANSTTRAVILSLEETVDVDSTALDALAEGEAQLQRMQRRLYLARVKEETRDTFSRAGDLDLISPARCFWSVADAFDAAAAQVKTDMAAPKTARGAG
ncbi:SulP family inorganic anion transporter [Methylovirgula sp. 4M-Z18]|uniref:SulP family inorganic anion transporter n=1 Tax=Methylovirgula sp. 4M-Z18 TaxID=2293567 RepID=UPI000E2FE8E1|nr:SulP family inorganic anion transporter [Methylovirgula sp. 4M-Z18]RFB79058.1 SulP family inorganic anion transporter [Methylovirgula sp. 4M-Z18]